MTGPIQHSILEDAQGIAFGVCMAGYAQLTFDIPLFAVSLIFWIGTHWNGRFSVLWFSTCFPAINDRRDRYIAT